MENTESQIFTAIWDAIFHIPHFHKTKNILHQLRTADHLFCTMARGGSAARAIGIFGDAYTAKEKVTRSFYT